MEIEAQPRRSRRAILAGAFGAGVATLLSGLARPAPAEATNGDAVLLGANPANLTGTGTNEATARTGIFSTSMSCFSAHSGAASGPAIGVQGQSDSPSGMGVVGVVNATDGAGNGVRGVAPTPAGSGVFGWASSASGQNYGVQGQTESTGGIGVRGYASATSGTTTGVQGQADSPGGIGVRGVGAAASGVAIGVQGETHSPTGTGVYATATTGTALRVAGKAAFSRSGRSTVTAGRAYVDVNLTAKGGLSGGPLILATLQYYRSGVSVAGVRPNYPKAGWFRIYLNKAVASATYVGWFVAG